MLRLYSCDWCYKIAALTRLQDPKKRSYCCSGCRDADTLFRLMWSDTAQRKSAHYRKLTEGEPKRPNH